MRIVFCVSLFEHDAKFVPELLFVELQKRQVGRYVFEFGDESNVDVVMLLVESMSVQDDFVGFIKAAERVCFDAGLVASEKDNFM